MSDNDDTPAMPAEAEVHSQAEEAGETSRSAEAGETVDAVAAEHAKDREGKKLTLLEWAMKKGHVPAPAGGFGLRVRNRYTGALLGERRLGGQTPVVHTQQADGSLARSVRAPLHKGPHYLVVAAHLGRPTNQLLTEAEYDAAVAGAYSVAIGESARRVEG